MDIVGIDIAKAKFDAALLAGTRTRHAAFSNTEAGFEQLLTWLAMKLPHSRGVVGSLGGYGSALAASISAS